MKFCLITFRSVTPAQRAENLLYRNGIGCNMQRTQSWMEEQGCGYSLRIRQKDVANSVSFLHHHKIPFRKVYVYHEDGTAEELSV